MQSKSQLKKCSSAMPDTSEWHRNLLSVPKTKEAPPTTNSESFLLSV